MDNGEPQEHDPGFLFSLNLMVLGGVLLLFVIITLNKIITHYFSDFFDHSRGILYAVNEMESETFRINNQAELYLTWFALVLSLTGLVIVVVKLVRTWNH